jgi:hypothetical protein
MDGSIVSRRGRRRGNGERAEVGVWSPGMGEIRYPGWVH